MSPRPRPRIRPISAVQRPTPRKAVNRSIAASSSSAATPSSESAPPANASARPRIAFAFASERRKRRSAEGVSAAKDPGSGKARKVSPSNRARRPKLSDSSRRMSYAKKRLTCCARIAVTRASQSDGTPAARSPRKSRIASPITGSPPNAR